MKTSYAFAVALCLAFTAHSTMAAPAAGKTAQKAPGSKWPSKSMERPRPKIVTPADVANPGGPPSDAIVLFDGTNIDAWKLSAKKGGEVPAECPWKMENGYIEVHPPRTELTTKREFGDCQIHIEWATPAEVSGSGQGRGNSGILLVGQCEIQVLDSYENDTYPDGQAGALYGKYPPLVNASRKPGEWQTYDIVYMAPKLKAGKVEVPAQLTVFHNGVLIHHAANPGGNAERIRICLMDHNNPVRFRNIWVRELHGYPE